MDKISGILPSSSRVASVNLSESGTVRPGTPGFGRAEGASALRDAKVGGTAGRAAKISQEQLDWRSKDMKNAATVRELSDRFFKGNDKPASDREIQSVIEKEVNLAPIRTATPSVPAGFDFEIPQSSATTSEDQPEGLHPRGSFIDVRA